MRGRGDKEPGQSSRQQRLCREKGVAKGVRGGREREGRQRWRSPREGRPRRGQ